MAKVQKSMITKQINKAASITNLDSRVTSPRITFYTRDKRRESIIYIRFSFNEDSKSVSTQIKTLRANFDCANGIIKGDKIGTDRLSYLKNEFNKVIADMRMTGRNIDLSLVKALVFGLDIQQIPTAILCLERFFDEVVTKEYKAGQIVKASFDKLHNWTVKVRTYIIFKHGNKAPISDIVPADGKNYTLWLQTEKAISINVAMNMTEYFKRVMNYAVENEWISRNPLMNFKKQLQKKRSVFLTTQEVASLENVAIASDVLARIKDLFLFQIYTGLAYAELHALSQEHLKNVDGTLSIIIPRKKTKRHAPESCVIPLSDKALQILAKYSDENRSKCFFVNPNQKINAYLKQLGAIADIKKNLTTHVARHTFAEYYLNEAGVRVEVLSKMLGHSTPATTLRHYASVKPETIIREFNQVLNFKKG